MPLVSIIVPNYNHAKYLPQRLESILKQTFQDFELILLDDHSTDNSFEVLLEYANHPKVSHLLLNEKNSGSPFIQWNRGVNLAKGDIIWIAESDDVSDKDFLSTLVPKFEADEKLGLAYCQSYRFNDKNEIVGSWLHYTEDLDENIFLSQFSMNGPDYIQKFLIHKNTIPNASAVLFRKKNYQMAGLADEQVRTCSDWLTWLKILALSDVYYHPLSLNYFRFHETSVVANAQKNKQQFSYFELHGGIMRLKFHEFLKGFIQKDNTYQRISDLNYTYIADDYGRQGLLLLDQKEWLGGIGNVVKASYISGGNPRFIKLAIRQLINYILNKH